MTIAYLFVAAAALAVIPILFFFKISMEELKENPSEKNKIQANFFKWVAISEALPILLIVLGIMNLNSVSSIEELYSPGLIVVVLMVVAVLFIFLQKSIGVPQEVKVFVKTFAMIGLIITNAIPLVAIVFMVMMIP